MDRKICKKCGLEKPITDFAPQKDRANGASWCRVCCSNRYKFKYHSDSAYREKKKRSAITSYYNLTPEQRVKNLKDWRAKNRARYWAYGTIRHHKDKGFIVCITVDELEQIAKTTLTCNICGEDLNWNGDRTNSKSPTLDRVENENFITKNNSQIICHGCNVRKGDLPMGKFIEYCKLITITHAK